MGFGTNNPRLRPEVAKNPQRAVQFNGAPERFKQNRAGSAGSAPRKPPGSRPDLRGGRSKQR